MTEAQEVRARAKALRERREDIAPLATFFLDYYCKRYSRTKVLSRRVIEQLKPTTGPATSGS